MILFLPLYLAKINKLDRILKIKIEASQYIIINIYGYLSKYVNSKMRHERVEKLSKRVVFCTFFNEYNRSVKSIKCIKIDVCLADYRCIIADVIQCKNKIYSCYK